MKKTLIYFTFLFISLSCFAQLPYKFWGLEIGKSNKQDVINFLKKNNYQYEIVGEGRDIRFEINKTIKYDNINWENLSFEIYDNILFMVSFSNKNNLDILDNVKNNLKKKYSKYIKTDENNYISFNDKKVRLFLLKDLGLILMAFTDMSIMDKMTQEATSNKDYKKLEALPRKILDVTLGKSTTSEVISTFVDKYRYYPVDNGVYCFEMEGDEYLGHQWDRFFCEFKNGILDNIWFLRRTDSDLEYGALAYLFQQFMGNFLVDYQEKSLTYYDGSTVIELKTDSDLLEPELPNIIMLLYQNVPK